MLLYTLVYGAMPFDGSNFKRLVKQISSGEYYEPPDKPSSWFTFLTNKILDGILFIFHNFFLLLLSSSILERVQLLRLWFATCSWSIRPNGPTSRTFAPTGKVYQVENDGRH